MDYLIVILFILVLFAIFICLENSGYFKKENKPQVVEGLSSSFIQGIQETRDMSGVGLCKASDANDCPGGVIGNNNTCPGVWDEQSCTGLTGYTLTWKDVDEKVSTLGELGITDEGIISNELTIEPGDVVSVNDESYISRSPVSLNINTERNAFTALQPFMFDGKTEYCLNEAGEYISTATTKTTCEAEEGRQWVTPFEWSSELPASWNSSACGLSLSEGGAGDGNEGSGKRDCFKSPEIKVPVCSNSSGQVKPKSFWKAMHTPGKTLKELCEGTPTGRDWQLTAIANTLYNNQQLAELSAQTSHKLLVEDNEAALLEHNARIRERNLSSDAQAFLENQRALHEASLDKDCTFENTTTPYHGNVLSGSRGTVNGYICGDQEDKLGATSIRTNCQSMTCDSTNFKRNSLNMNILCSSDGNFYYQGCEPNVCKIPANFSQKYKFKDGIPRPAGTEVTINDVRDMLNDDEYKVECRPDTHYGTPTNISCPDGGDLNISGCDVNRCSTSCGDGYEFKGENCSVENVSEENFNENMGMSSSWELCDTDINGMNGPCFRCEAPNYFHAITDDETYTTYYNEKVNKVCNALLPENKSVCSGATTEDDCNAIVSSTGEQLCEHSLTRMKDIQNYPTVRCPVDGGNFIREGCFPNKCINPSKVNDHYVYDSSRVDDSNVLIKPEHINDHTKLENDNIYSKYKYDSSISSEDNITLAEIENKLECGVNYTKAGENDSSDIADKVIPLENIQCYNFYDYHNKSSSTTPVPNFSTPPEGAGEGETITYIPSEDDLPTYLTQNTSIPRNHYFSVGGCEENYCQWPTYVDNTSDIPMERNVDGVINDGNGKRYVLGYKHGNLDVTTTQSAANFAGYTEEGGPTLTCETECIPEPKYTYEDINGFFTRPQNERERGLIKMGENNGLDTAESFHQVARGGPFSISRCWKETISGTPPTVKCNGTGCNSTDSECTAVVSGCEQKKCKLSTADQESGTRILIQETDGAFKSIGHTGRNALEHDAFNVDQIRHISCDNQYSKPLQDDGTILDMVVSCPEDGGEFVIENKCVRTECVGTTISEPINLTSIDGDVNSICPNKTWEDSHIGMNSLSTVPHSLGDDVTVQNQNQIDSYDPCGIDSSPVNDAIMEFNKSRYHPLTRNGTIAPTGPPPMCNINSSNETGASVQGPGPMGASVECNYTPNFNVNTEGSTFAKPNYQLSGCQPKLCKIPAESEKYSYNNLVEGETISKDLLVGPYFSSEKPDFLQEASYNSHISKGITCADGYNGTVDLNCRSGPPASFPGGLFEFDISGCTKNECVIPNRDAPSGSDGFLAYEALTEDEQGLWNDIQNQYDLSSILRNYNGGTTINSDNLTIQCGPNHVENPNLPAITCPENGGAFQNLIKNNDTDGYCIEETCTVPTTLYTDGTTEVEGIRKSIREGNLDSVLGEREVSAEERTYLETYGPQSSQLTAYKLANGNDLTVTIDPNELSMDIFNGIECTDNYKEDGDGIEVGCSNGEYTFKGCTEKYCTLPPIHENLLYRQQGWSKLKLLEDIQGVGITKNQFDNTYNSDLEFSCAPYAAVDGEVSVSCNEDGQPFVYQGCVELTLPAQNHTTGHIIYEYYPGTCIGRRENAFIYISGTEPWMGRSSDVVNVDDSKGSSVTHTLITSELDTDGDKYYYNTETKHAQPDHPNPGNDLPANWIETTTKLKYEEKPKELINQLMHGFMEVSKEYCDKIESSSGFIVRQIDKLTAEVYNIQQAGGTPGDIDNDVLLAHLNNPEKDILEYGTLLSEQKSPQDAPDGCTQEFIEGSNWYENWGATSKGGNAHIYNTGDVEGQEHDILNHEVIPQRTSIYFKKRILTEPVADATRGWTNRDEDLP